MFYPTPLTTWEAPEPDVVAGWDTDAFTSNRTGVTSTIWVMNTDGSDQHLVIGQKLIVERRGPRLVA